MALLKLITENKVQFGLNNTGFKSGGVRNGLVDTLKFNEPLTPKELDMVKAIAKVNFFSI